MTRPPLADLPVAVAAEGAACRVTLIRSSGSAPAPQGAAMTVALARFDGTIGGGALEFEALRQARRMLAPAALAACDVTWRRRTVDYPLGPSLGQCCGGHVTLLFEVFGPAEAAALATLAADVDPDAPDFLRPAASGAPLARGDGRLAAPDWFAEPVAWRETPLFLYGAGHVGQAVVRAFQDLPFEIFWVDVGPERFPDIRRPGLNLAPARDMAAVAKFAPGDGWHVVMTYSHAIDYAICHAVLARGEFAYLGLIASATKRARFEKRLAEAGAPAAAIRRLHAPIGLPGLPGKAPAVIAASLAADLLQRRAAMAERLTAEAAE